METINKVYSKRATQNLYYRYLSRVPKVARKESLTFSTFPFFFLRRFNQLFKKLGIFSEKLLMSKRDN